MSHLQNTHAILGSGIVYTVTMKVFANIVGNIIPCVESHSRN